MNKDINNFEKKNQSTISSYLSQLRNLPQLSHEETIELFKKLDLDKNNKIVRNKIIECNLRLVVLIAKSFYKNARLPLEDLIQEGNTGLMRSIDKFKWQKGFKFGTYASWWIRQAIGQYITNNKTTVRLPVHAQAVQKKIIEATDKFKLEFGVDPDYDEIKDLVDATDTVINATMHSGRGSISLSSPVSNNCDETIGDKIECNVFDNDPLEILSRKELSKIFKSVLDTLSKKERILIRLRYGITDDIDENDYKLSEETIKEIIS